LFSDTELAFVMTRYRQIHDFLHTLTGLPISILGEVSLKLFEYFQTGLPMTFLASLVGPLRLSPKELSMFYRLYWPWVLRNASSSKLLLNIYFEKHFSDDLTEFRQYLNIEPFVEHDK
jgi:ubiquinone biosynthesis protein COQ4